MSWEKHVFYYCSSFGHIGTPVRIPRAFLAPILSIFTSKDPLGTIFGPNRLRRHENLKQTNVLKADYDDKIKQLTFYCREKGRLSLLFTSDLHTLTLKNSKDRRLERYIFDLELNTKNKNDTDYKENIIDKKRLSERNDDANHYLSVELNNSETLKIMDSKEISLEINGPRVMGYYTAYLPLNHNVKETLTLIMKNCF